MKADSNRDYTYIDSKKIHTGTKCIKCDSSNHFSLEQAQLFALGLWPHLCKGCNELKTNTKFPAIMQYLMGDL